MPRALSEQVLVLTGASSGVGHETALQLAEQGATIVAAARNTEALGTFTAEVERLGGTITMVPTDASGRDQVQAWLSGVRVARVKGLREHRLTR